MMSRLIWPCADPEEDGGLDPPKSHSPRRKITKLHVGLLRNIGIDTRENHKATCTQAAVSVRQSSARQRTAI